MSDKFVLFLDILGFSQLVSRNSPDELNKIYDTEFHKAAAASTTFAGPMFGRMPNLSMHVHGNVLQDVKQDGLNFHVMSDTLIAWTNDDTFETLVNLTQFTAAYLSITLMLGMPHRGAISKGGIQLIELPLNGKLQTNVVGSGVVNAHDFEPGQDWMGCVVDPVCIEGLEVSRRADFPVVDYKVPYGGKKPKRTSTMAIDWPRCLMQLQANVDIEFFEQQFGRYKKGTEFARSKIENTAAYYSVMTSSRSTVV